MQDIKNSSKPADIVKLDLKDKKILYELEFNGRISFSKLARYVGISKRSAEFRIKRLLSTGVVKRFYPLINLERLGYIRCRLLLSFRNATKTERKKILSFFLKKKLWISKGEGFYDILVSTHVKSLVEYKKFIEEMKAKFKDKIEIKSEGVIIDNIIFQRRFLLGRKETKEIHFREYPEKLHIDKLDQKIISILRGDARIPTIMIAKKVKQSPKVVAYRIKKMEIKKIIEGYNPEIDYSKIGYRYYKLLFNLKKISQNKLEKLKNYIKSNPMTFAMIEDIGVLRDLNIEVIVNSDKHLFDFIQDIKSKFPGVLEEHEAILCSSGGHIRGYTGQL